jgi:Ca2+-binding RTX toxin-like protein
VTGGSANDTIDASALGEAINIVGNGGNNVLTGTNQVDTIAGGGADDTITGGALADSLSGGAGANRFQYGDAEFITAETVTGGAGVDTILFTANAQTVADAAFANKTLLEALTTGNGNNSVTLGAVAGAAFATITVTGGSGVDTINAADLGRAATILGGDGNDILTGSNQADQFTGSNGNDQLTGGAGVDTFRYGANGVSAQASATANGADVITGFVAGGGGDIAAFNVAIDGGTALTGGIAALGAVQTANPGAAQNNAINTYIRLVDIVGGQDITTAAGLQTALGGGGEYANVQAAAAGNFIFVTAASGATQSMNVFYGNAGGAGAIGNIVSLGTIALTGADTINTLVAGNFA